MPLPGWIHQKCRDNLYGPKNYPKRYSFSDELTPWSVSFPAYLPPYFTDLRTLIAASSRRQIDPEKLDGAKRESLAERGSFSGNILFDCHGRPLNPIGRTGLAGRGNFWRWGPNFAADGVFWRIFDGNLQFVFIERKSGELALPGGMIDDGETNEEACRREMSEEVGFSRDNLVRLTTVFSGYVDDPRNTDNSWAETTAFLFCPPPGSLEHNKFMSDFVPCAGDDAKKAMWVDFSLDYLIRDMLYASHQIILKAAVSYLSRNYGISIGHVIS